MPSRRATGPSEPARLLFPLLQTSYNHPTQRGLRKVMEAADHFRQGAVGRQGWEWFAETHTEYRTPGQGWRSPSLLTKKLSASQKNASKQ